MNAESVDKSRGEGTYDKVCRNIFLSSSDNVTIFDLEVVCEIAENQFHPTVEVLFTNAFPPALWISVVQDKLKAMNDGYILFLFDCQ